MKLLDLKVKFSEEEIVQMCIEKAIVNYSPTIEGEWVHVRSNYSWDVGNVTLKFVPKVVEEVEQVEVAVESKMEKE